MGLGAVALWVKGHLEEEMPRYLYQRLRYYHIVFVFVFVLVLPFVFVFVFVFGKISPQ